jgi:hypothetical protein
VFGCAGIDPDCTTTCGDGVCIGNAGELCSTCTADCMTTAPVCGNGTCDPGEAAAACVADCGPMPWPWTQEEADLLVQVNAMRTAGFMCPGGMRPAQPAWTPGPWLDDARDWVWEYAHHDFMLPTLDTCRGVTRSQLSMAGNNYSVLFAGNAVFVADAINVWQNDGSFCDAIMNPMWTQAVVAAGHDVKHGYFMIFR